MNRRGRLAGLIVALAVLTACQDQDPVVTARAEVGAVEARVVEPSTTTTATVPTTVAPPESSSTPEVAASPPPVEPAPTTTTRAPRLHSPIATGFSVYATVGPLELRHPAARIEAIGFHQASHDGAQDQVPSASAVAPIVMPSRGRGTGARSAADIVVPPDEVIRSVVTGTVIRGGSYTLYCDNIDEYLVIEPAGMPGWEVKMLHMVGLTVSVGSRVEAGITQVAAHSHQLPFRSQVDDHTGEPAWGHVHVEVVDTSIPDRPGGGGC